MQWLARSESPYSYDLVTKTTRLVLHGNIMLVKRWRPVKSIIILDPRWSLNCCLLVYHHLTIPAVSCLIYKAFYSIIHLCIYSFYPSCFHCYYPYFYHLVATFINLSFTVRYCAIQAGYVRCIWWWVEGWCGRVGEGMWGREWVCVQGRQCTVVCFKSDPEFENKKWVQKKTCILPQIEGSVEMTKQETKQSLRQTWWILLWRVTHTVLNVN